MRIVLSNVCTVKTNFHIRMKKHYNHLDSDIQSTRECVWKVRVLQLKTRHATRNHVLLNVSNAKTVYP
jgi:hypothetical protein